MTTPTSMGNHGGTVTSCSPYAYPGFAEICILLRTWSTVAPGTYELAFLIKKKKKIPRLSTLFRTIEHVHGPPRSFSTWMPMPYLPRTTGSPISAEAPRLN